MRFRSFAAAAVRAAWSRHRLTQILEGLNDRYLRDMGLERGMIDEYVTRAYPWPSVKADPERQVVVSLQGCG